MNKPFWLHLLPLGGLSEIGQNMMLICTKQEWIIIDCGIQFPNDHNFNIQYMTVPFQRLAFPKKTILIVTHAHEDHIGAISDLLKQHSHIKVFASSFAKRVLESKFRYANLQNKEIHVFSEESVFELGTVDIHPVHVNHSIPQTFGLLFRSKNKKAALFFASDFKYDNRSPYEKPFNLDKLKSLTQKSLVRMLMLDSTNILEEEKTTSEKDIIKPLETILRDRQQRTFITFFPSNIHRLQTIINVAKRLKRKVVYVGRSLEFYLQVARHEKLLKNVEETFCPLEKVDPNNQDDLIILLTGCQGDFKGALARVVRGQHPLFQLKQGDLILFSSKTIPGNEKTISKLVNEAYEKKARVITVKDALLHTSGHASQHDLATVIKSYSPTISVPIHGESSFLFKHTEFMRKISPKTRCDTLLNFQSMTLTEKGETQFFTHEALPSNTYLDGGTLIERAPLKERKKIALSGLVEVVVARTKQGPFDVALKFLGIPLVAHDHFHSLKETIIKEVVSYKGDEKDEEKERENLRLLVRRFLKPYVNGKVEVSVILMKLG